MGASNQQHSVSQRDFYCRLGLLQQNATTGVLPARKEIEEQVAAYRKTLMERAHTLTLHQSLAHVHRLGRQLYAWLLQPVESALTSSRMLVILPDGALDYLPFETLVTNSGKGASGEGRPTFLVERFAIVYGPSASALITPSTKLMTLFSWRRI
jgi:CHAT domain-containing protein